MGEKWGGGSVRPSTCTYLVQSRGVLEWQPTEQLLLHRLSAWTWRYFTKVGGSAVVRQLQYKVQLRLVDQEPDLSGLGFPWTPVSAVTVTAHNGLVGMAGSFLTRPVPPARRREPLLWPPDGTCAAALGVAIRAVAFLNTTRGRAESHCKIVYLRVVHSCQAAHRYPLR